MTLKTATAQLRNYVQGSKKPPLPPATKVDLHRELAEAVGDLKRQHAAAQPTPELLGKGGFSNEPIYSPKGIEIGRQYRSKCPIETYKASWPDDIATAFSVYIKDAHAADQMGITINYDGNSSRGGVGKIGGLGNCHDRQRDAYARLQWINERITFGSLQVIRWLVLEVAREATGQRMSLEEAGHQIFPSIRDKATARGIALGRLMGAGAELARAYRIHHAISSDDQRPMKMVGDL